MIYRVDRDTVSQGQTFSHVIIERRVVLVFGFPLFEILFWLFCCGFFDVFSRFHAFVKKTYDRVLRPIPGAPDVRIIVQCRQVVIVSYEINRMVPPVICVLKV